MFKTLIRRVEELTKPDRMLDGLIAKALYPHLEWVEFEDTWCSRHPTDYGAFAPAEAYTGDLNAALGLFLPTVLMSLVGPSGDTHVCRLTYYSMQNSLIYEGVGIAKIRPAAITSAALRLFEGMGYVPKV